MARTIKYIGSLLIAILMSWLIISGIAYPTLQSYSRVAHVMARYPYTEITLIVFLTLSVWLFYLQFSARKFSVIYLYLVYAVYLFLLFVVLFTKAEHYQAFSGDPFDFLKWDRRALTEALLNVIYFIPLGGLYGLKADFKEFMVIALLTITGIETLQYIFYLGTFAVSDILLNWLGCLIGFLLCRQLKHSLQLIV